MCPKILIGLASASCLLLGCGTSSDAAQRNDGGAAADGAPFNDAGDTCNAFGVPTCGRGRTCCFAGLSGSCADLSACHSHVQFECGQPDQCNPGETCCANIPLGLDASAIGLPLGGDGGPALVGVTAESFCSSQCSSPGFMICITSSDCPGGSVCSQLPEGDLLLLALGAETLGVCAARDGG